jgi:type II secretory pathway pseudopilin PulG
MRTFFSYTSNTKGFSLAELIIYLGILGVSAGIFGGVLNSISTTQINEFNQNEVSGQLNFAIQTVQRLIRTSSIIEGESGVASGTLVLQMPSEEQSPTTIYTENNRLYFMQGAEGIPQAITNERVSVDSIEFRKFARPGAKDIVQIDMALSQTQPTGERIARSLRSAVTRVDAAAFDGDLLPNADNAYDIGSIGLRWRDGWFSGQLHAGQFCIGTGDCISSWAGAGVTGSGSANYITKWNTGSTIAASSLLYDNGITVGINTVNPNASSVLDVNGNINATGLCIAGDCKTAWTGISSQWTTASTSIYYNAGNVGIGTSSPSELLEVAGNIKLSGSTPTYKLTNVATPTANSDVATKAYVDAATADAATGDTLISNTSGWNYTHIYNSTSHNGNFGGLSGANTYCETTKPASVPNGLTYKAYLCDTTTCQKPNAPHPNNIVLFHSYNGSAINWTIPSRFKSPDYDTSTLQVTYTSSFNPLLEGLGAVIRGNTLSSYGISNDWWSGSAYSYINNYYELKPSSSNTCNNWTSSLSSDYGIPGSATEPGYSSLSVANSTLPCNTQKSLLCFAQ